MEGGGMIRLDQIPYPNGAIVPTTPIGGTPLPWSGSGDPSSLALSCVPIKALFASTHLVW